MRPTFLEKADHYFPGILVRWCYPLYVRPKYGYLKNSSLLFRYLFFQKIWRINGHVKWPVHFTSVIHCPERIQKGILCDPGDSPGVYINALNGIFFGNNIEIGPGVKILSTNHDPGDYRSPTAEQPIRIGNDVWIGANAIILPGISIGNNVVIGAGSVVTQDIPDNSVAVGNPCRVIKSKEAYQTDIGEIALNRRF